MPIADQWRWCVAFIVIDEQDDSGAWVRKPKGTGFFVRMSEWLRQEKPYRWIDYIYLVTARHVARRANPGYVRVHLKGSAESRRLVAGVRDVPIEGRWFVNHDDTKDVAVIPVNLPRHEYWFMPINVSEHHKDDSPLTFVSQRAVGLGERVFFIGLLANAERMGEDNVPMVRTGTLGAVWQEGIPVREHPGGRPWEAKGHLIDCHSYGGFSGSPVILHRDTTMLRSYAEPLQSHVIGGETITKFRQEEKELTEFLGMMSGHFTDYLTIKPRTTHGEEWEDTLRLEMNAHVGVVVPKDHIVETLMQEELVRDRAKRKKRALEKLDAEERGETDAAGEIEYGDATADSARPGPDPERLKIDETMDEAVEKAMKKKKPEEGWPDD